MSFLLKYDGSDLSAEPYNLTVLDDGFSTSLLPAGRVSRKDLGARDGIVMHGGGLDSRIFDVEVEVAGNSRAAIQSSLDALAARISRVEDKSLQFGLWSDRYWMGRLVNESAFDPIGLMDSGAICRLRLECQDPHASALTETEQEETITASPQDIVVDAEDLANGNRSAEPTFEVECTGGANTIYVWNQTTGEMLTWRNALAAEYWWKADCAQKLIYTSPDGSNWTLTMAGKEGEWPTLTPGVDNELRVAGFGTSGNMTITYRERFE